MSQTALLFPEAETLAERAVRSFSDDAAARIARFALLRRLDKAEEAVTQADIEAQIALTGEERYLRECWAHYVAVRANTPPAWDAHCRFAIEPCGLLHTVDFRPNFSTVVADTVHFEVRGPVAGVSETGYMSEIRTIHDRSAWPTPREFAQELAETRIAERRAEEAKTSRRKSGRNRAAA